MGLCWDGSAGGRALLFVGGRLRGFFVFGGCRFGGDGFVEDEDAVGGEIVVAGESLAGEEVVHGFVEVETDV